MTDDQLPMTSDQVTNDGISAKNLSKRFNREWIFRDINFSFGGHNIIAVTGPNGSGKSTLLQVLSGYIPPSAGTITYEVSGKPVASDEVFQHISFAAPYMDLIEEFTLLEHLKLHFRLKRIRYNLSVDELIRRMYLEGARDKYISNFSSGMKQRLKLALAFYTDARIIMLDEPGTNLDSRAFDWYLSELARARENALIIIASNNEKEYPGARYILKMEEYK